MNARGVGRGNGFFSSANQDSYPMRKRGLSSGLKRPGMQLSECKVKSI